MAIVRQELTFDNLIEFRSKTHQYFTRNTGEEYKPVTSGLKCIKEPFDADGIAFAMAKAEFGWDCNDINLIQKRKEELKKEWTDKAEEAATYGTAIHGVYEGYRKDGVYDEKYGKMIYKINEIISGAYHVFSERIYYSQKYKIAGTCDLSVLRQKMKFPVMDFYDFKTNISRGILYDSIKRKADGSLKHYNRYLLHPVDYIEDCNYNLYALQLSIYALMAQVTYNIKVGRLAILFINKDFDVEYIPVPYMKMEAELVLDYVSKVKSINEVLDDGFFNFN